MSSSDPVWDAIPYVTYSDYQGYPSGNTTRDNYLTTLSSSDFANYKGDICQFLNPAYRMPIYAEFGNDGNYTGIDQMHRIARGYELATEIDGQTIFPSAYDDEYGIKFAISGSSATWFWPASGYRSSTGRLYYVGTMGKYWSSGAGSHSIGHEQADGFSFDLSNGLAWSAYPYRNNAVSVRCVLK